MKEIFFKSRNFQSSINSYGPFILTFISHEAVEGWMKRPGRNEHSGRQRTAQDLDREVMLLTEVVMHITDWLDDGLSGECSKKRRVHGCVVFYEECRF